MPKLGNKADRLITIAGTVPNPARFPTGCKFHPRCPHSRELATSAQPQDTVAIRSGDEEVRILKRCQQDEPTLREVMPDHGAACHQISQYDQAKPMTPRSEHRREVVPQAVEMIARQEVGS